jgi:hypothetical protein
MKVGTLFKYRYPYGTHELKYGVIIDELNDKTETFVVQWIGDGSLPYKAVKQDLINLLKSGSEESGIIA